MADAVYRATLEAVEAAVEAGRRRPEQANQIRQLLAAGREACANFFSLRC